jgi:hypothetical protein
MRVTGEVILDGRRHSVDCVTNRDHSWSPRAEFRHAPGTFDLIHFDEELTFLTHTAERDDRTPVVTNGYVLRDGAVRQLTEASVNYTKEGFRTLELEYTATDSQGDQYRITGRRRACAEIDGGQNIYVVMDLLDCEWEGRTGYGEVQWHDEISRLQGLMAQSAAAGVQAT